MRGIHVQVYFWSGYSSIFQVGLGSTHTHFITERLIRRDVEKKGLEFWLTKLIAYEFFIWVLFKPKSNFLVAYYDFIRLLALCYENPFDIISL